MNTCFLRRLPLDGAKNTRDIGGYPCPGGAVRWGAFVRSDCPDCLSEKDIDFLRAYGISDVVDLRQKEETLKAPSALLNAPGFAVHHLSLNNSMRNINFQGDVPGSMAGFYILLLDEAQKEIGQVITAITNAKGGVLFHCAVGKDRTGVIAMLLLKLAGVCDEDIVADYAVTDIYMREVFAQQQGAFNHMDIPEFILKSRPASMERVLRHLKEKYNTPREYLLLCGVLSSTLNALCKKLLGPTCGKNTALNGTTLRLD